MLTLQGHRAAVMSLAYSPKSATLATGSADKTVQLWDLRRRETMATLKGHRTYAHAVAFTADGRELASAGGDVYLRDPASGGSTVARQEGGRPIAGLALSPDGRLLITVGRRMGGANTPIAGDVKFWDAAGATAILAASKDQPRRRGAMEIRPAAEALGEAALAEHLSNHRWGAWSIALDPSGTLLAVGTDSGGVLLWDLPAARPAGRLEARAVIRSPVFSGDGQLLAAAEGSRVRVWDVRTGASLATLKGHEKQVWSVAFFPRSSAARASLLSGSQDGTVRVWDVNPPRERTVFAWPTGPVYSVAVAPDGMTAAAGGDNGSAVLWDCDE